MGQFALGVLGGAGQGFAQGQLLAKRHGLEKEEVDLRKKALDLQEKTYGLQLRKLEHEIGGQEGIRRLIQQLLGGGGQPQAPTEPEQVGGPGFGEAAPASVVPPGPTMQPGAGLQLEGINLGGEGPSLRLRRPQKPSATDELSLSMFGKPFTQLDQSQQQTVLRTEQERKVEVSAAQGAAGVLAKGAAEEDLPLNEKAALWLHPETGEAAKARDSLKDIKSKGFVPVTQEGLTASATAKAALAQLKEYRELAERLLIKTSGDSFKDATNIQKNRLKLLGKRLSGDPDAKRLEGLFGGIATLARATGDTANIAVVERQFLRDFVLNETDSFESGMAKVDQAERILRAVVEGRGVPIPKSPPKETLKPKAKTLEDYMRGFGARP